MKIYENLDINNFDDEIWKTIEEYPDYQVSNYGRVKSLKFGKNKILKQSKNSDDYFQICLYKNGKYKSKKVHILVFEAFNYKLKNGECVHHIDENKENNKYDNFELMTKKKHSRIHNKGKILSESTKKLLSKPKSEESKNKMSESNPRKLSDQKYIDIRIDIEKGNLKHREIAKKHGVSCAIISYIKTGKRGNVVKDIKNENSN